jgi:hypothetical protein
MAPGRKIYVQYGCGFCAPAEWLNFDASLTLRLERLYGLGRLVNKNGQRFPDNVRFGDIVCGLNLPDGSVHAIYASHILEHLSLEECRMALHNTFKLLEAGGIFRLVVPDLAWRAEQYVSSLGKRDAGAAGVFMKKCHLGVESSPKSLIGKLSWLFGGSTHRWMWDEFAMREALFNAGFEDVRRCEIGDSGDPMFDLVEDRGRFSDNGFAELAFQAKKPAHSRPAGAVRTGAGASP